MEISEKGLRDLAGGVFNLAFQLGKASRSVYGLADLAKLCPTDDTIWEANPHQTIVIEVENNCVTSVLGLPAGYRYKVIYWDIIDRQ